MKEVSSYLQNINRKQILACLAIVASISLLVWILQTVKTYAADTPTFYVSNTVGDDANPGTIDLPWKTIQKAATTVTPGSTVLIRGGTYIENVVPSVSGTAAAPITFKAYPGEVPILTQVSQQAIYVNGNSYLVFDGFNINNTNGHWMSIWNSAHITVQNCNFSKELANIMGFYITDSSYITVQDCTISEAYNTSVEDKDLIYVNNSNHNLFQRLDLTKGPHSLINLWNTSYTVIQNNTLHNDWQKNLDIYSDVRGFAGRNVIQNNKLYGSLPAPSLPDKGGFAIQVAQPSTIVRNNNIYNNAYYGVLIDAFRSGSGGALAANDNRIYNNVFNNNGWKTSPSGINSGVVITDWDSRRDITNNVVKNNIFFNDTNKEYYIYKDFQGNTLVNNCVMGATLNAQTINVTTYGANTLSYYQTKYPASINNNLEVNPMFVDGTNADYRLQTGSPCIDKGQALTKTTVAGTGNVVTVADAKYFTDGYGIIPGDNVVVGTNAPVLVTAVDLVNNKLTLASAITWNANDSVNLPYLGSAPDMGSSEYDPSNPPIITPAPTPDPTPVSDPMPTPTPVPPPPPAPDPIPSNAFKGEYFDNKDLTGLKLTRTDAAINFDWGTGSPATGINQDSFSARWTGNWDFATGGAYKFTATVDDGMRVWIDNTLVLDKWITEAKPVIFNFTQNLTAGTHQIKVEYFESIKTAVAKLSWTL